MVNRLFKGLVILFASTALTGCLVVQHKSTSKRKNVKAPPVVTRAAPVEVAAGANSFAQQDESAIINSLLLRQSVIPSGSSFETVALSVLAANARPAEAELRASRLRAKAASKNWLPRIGPNISLSSLGSVVTGLIVQQVVFDNGQKKAERAFAAADVESVAVTLSQETNDRVLEALTLYLKMQQAQDAAQVSHQAQKRMEYFKGIMGERVRGGVSDSSDLRVIANKLREAENQTITDKETAEVAAAELNAMAATNLANVRGATSLQAAPTGLKPLNVLQAEAIRSRDIAQAKIERAQYLPGATVNGTIGDGGGANLDIAAPQLIGVGIRDQLAAVQAAEDAATRRVGQAVEDSNRSLRRLSQQMSALERQEGQAKALAESARANQQLFQDQFEAGTRTILEVISNYETAMRLERDYVRIKYDRLRVRLEIASKFGALVDGAKI